MLDLSRNLYQHQLSVLADVIAEISEMQYRRGFVDGANNPDAEIEPEKLLSLPLSWAPHPDTGQGGMPSLDRLALKHQQRLRQIGLYVAAPTNNDFELSTED
jgi:hypothetical protein